jgi:hypothetical protein
VLLDPEVEFVPVDVVNAADPYERKARMEHVSENVFAALTLDVGDPNATCKRFVGIGLV